VTEERPSNLLCLRERYSIIHILDVFTPREVENERLKFTSRTVPVEYMGSAERLQVLFMGERRSCNDRSKPREESQLND
jgi:hypothetical protein